MIDTNREENEHLIGQVCSGEVEAIFLPSVVRLTNGSASFERLLELCGLAGTLVCDARSIYDLRSPRDRRLLGLKARLTDRELHALGRRLRGIERAAAERGLLRLPLPVGYLYAANGAMIFDPDEYVQAAIAKLFAVFRATRAIQDVLDIFGAQAFPERTRDGVKVGRLRWRRLTASRVFDVLRDPTYAGAFVLGCFDSELVVSRDGSIKCRTVRLPRSSWTALIRDHHPGYIDWSEFLVNERHLSAGESGPVFGKRDRRSAIRRSQTYAGRGNSSGDRPVNNGY